MNAVTQKRWAAAFTLRYPRANGLSSRAPDFGKPARSLTRIWPSIRPSIHTPIAVPRRSPFENLRFAGQKPQIPAYNQK